MTELDINVEKVFGKAINNQIKINELIQILNKKTILQSQVESYQKKLIFTSDKFYEYDNVIKNKTNDILYENIEDLRKNISIIVKSKPKLYKLIQSEFQNLKSEYFEKNNFKLTAYYNGSNYIGNLDKNVKEGLGLYFDNKGYEFFGNWHDDAHQEGILIDRKEDKEEIFIGKFHFKENKYNFEGLYIPIFNNEQNNISFFYGKFDNENNLIDGCFVFQDKTNEFDVYFGKMKEFMKDDNLAILIHYKNLIDHSPLSIYLGSFLKDKKNSKGILIDTENNYILEIDYEEEKLKNVKAVCLLNSNKSIFHGDLNYQDNNNFSLGNSGLILSENNHIYNGDLKNGLKEGIGKYYFSKKGDKDIIIYFCLDGIFCNDKFTKGKIFQCENRELTNMAEIFNGELNDNLPIKGKIYYSKNETYEGTFVKGLRNGNGKYMFCDGSSYEGEWKDNKKHGNGIYIDTQSNEFKGIWNEDQLNEIQNYNKKP